MKRAMVALAGRTFMPFMSPGTTIFFLVEWNVPGSCAKVRQYLTSAISLPAYLRYQASSAALPALALANRNGSSMRPSRGSGRAHSPD